MNWYFLKEIFEGVLKAINSDNLQISFLFYDPGIFFNKSGLPPSQNFSNLTGIGNNKEGMPSIWSESLAEKPGFNQNVQYVNNVILTPCKGKMQEHQIEHEAIPLQKL